ncbi:hypothetical protein [Enterovibrio norvegicus]|uniref:Uncharacterized protein n=1 Tax=Enterovibrio norvegicus DSM 15893 TaxID=1121869 RepID=A0A1I5J968_9GAMM|nr:hypothetical protein [Enterovibrio norvegicus]PMH66002.1 hypothetical protein BCU62_10305 [Enterovibrio norvegicus]SFO68936.1 hypothetical protein SAMN03084138_00030 [Enterovibrio norvegicus DSM 15893]
METRIHSAYKGEVYGISFFTYFADHYSDSSANVATENAREALWEALVLVEALTADLLEETLKARGVSFDRNDEEMRRKGEEDAHAWVVLPWSELVKTLIHWVAPWELKYREWLDDAPADCHAVFLLIAEHETAIYQCWEAEQRGETGVDILNDFIRKYTAI